MPPVLGKIIVVAVLCVIVYFCAHSVIRDIKRELRGGGCASCPGGSCAGCGGCDAKNNRKN